MMASRDAAAAANVVDTGLSPRRYKFVNVGFVMGSPKAVEAVLEEMVAGANASHAVDQDVARARVIADALAATRDGAPRSTALDYVGALSVQLHHVNKDWRDFFFEGADGLFRSRALKPPDDVICFLHGNGNSRRFRATKIEYEAMVAAIENRTVALEADR